ncbi:hypothetical protein LCGC14_1778850 [marine sediment metagenome]|uniref:Uncharacterized protein n=1 Tax=marine sediment metagenome TaxID=412755 RepID=A0A0F9HIK2_9ZZZZ
MDEVACLMKHPHLPHWTYNWSRRWWCKGIPQMFNFIHRLTCKYREVHRLSPPQSLPITEEQKRLGPWTESSIQFKRHWNLSMEAWDERQNLSVPIPGPKDVTIG